MSSIIINSHFTDEKLHASYLEAVIQLFGSMGLSQESTVIGDITLLVTKPASSDSSIDMVSPDPGAQPADSMIMTIATSSQDEMPQPEMPPDPVNHEVILKNLSAVCAVPYTVDSSKPHTELMVKNISSMGEHICFTYCDMSYKFPIAKQDPNEHVDNDNPVFTDTSIRITTQLSGKDTSLHVLFNLVDTGEGAAVVFGQDIIHKI